MQYLVGRIAALALGTIAIFAQLAVCPPKAILLTPGGWVL